MRRSVLSRKVSLTTSGILILLVIGIVLRFLIASVGFTYDMQSYEIVAKIVHHGGIVYNETSRYNYGPLWFFLLSVLYAVARLFSDPFLIYRFLIVGILTISDVGIWFILKRRYSVLTSFLFFLNPVSIVITGYYSQFDTIAIFFGLLSMLLYEGKKPQQRFIGLLLLACSLLTKHIFFAFPLWLAIKEKTLIQKLQSFLVPLGISFLVMLPFLFISWDGIMAHVIKYTSFPNAPLWTFLVPDYLKRVLRKEFLFAGGMLLSAIVFRRKKPFEFLLSYTGVLVIFTHAMADQYLAIPLAYIASAWNIFFSGYTIVSTLFVFIMLRGGEMVFDPPGWLLARWNFSFTPMVVFLLLGMLWSEYRHRWNRIMFKHVLVFLLGANSILYGFIIIPSARENLVVHEIQNTLREGDYERANQLYSEIEKDPPFAGSRMWYKLSTVRASVEFYRNYRHAFDLYATPSPDMNWSEVERTLEWIPDTFPERTTAQEIYEYAKKQH